jgi:hypothetical protein
MDYMLPVKTRTFTLSLNDISEREGEREGEVSGENNLISKLSNSTYLEQCAIPFLMSHLISAHICTPPRH